MPNSKIPETPGYDTDSTIDRNEDEAYALDVWLLSGTATPSTCAYTYGRTEGLYKFSPTDDGQLVEEFDEIFATLQEKYGAVDESSFGRLDGDAYEVMAELVPTDDATPYDAEFNHNTAVVHVTPENDPELVERLDAVFEQLNEDISQ